MHKLTAARNVLFGHIPGQMVIQITNRCNGACPQCGMRKSAAIARHSLPVEHIKKTVRQCAQNGFGAVSFTGGEPFLDIPAVLDLLACAGREGIPLLRTGTNGYMLAGASTQQITDFVSRLAATSVRNFWISLDSADAKTHEAMRGLPGVVEGIQKALPIFHAHGIYPAANLGINRNLAGPCIAQLAGPHDEERFFTAFAQGFAAFFDRAIDMGFTMANLCYPMSSGNPELENAAYGAISDDWVVRFTPEELRLVFRALLEVVPAFRRKIRIFTPLSALYAMAQPEPARLFPCLGGVRFFYMDSRDGHIYPCGYLGEQDMGAEVDKAVQQGKQNTPHCRKCHWECFRDPSQLLGLARYIARHPIQALVRHKPDPALLRLWVQDMQYFLQNDFFNGRTAPNK